MLKRTTLIVTATIVVAAVAVMATPVAQAQDKTFMNRAYGSAPSGEDVRSLGYWQPGQWRYENGQRIWMSGHWVDTSQPSHAIEYRETPTYVVPVPQPIYMMPAPELTWRYVPGRWVQE